MRLGVMFLIVVFGLSGVLHAQPLLPELELLAGEWSAGRAAPICWPDNVPEDWGLPPGRGQCTWPAVSGGGRAWGQVTGHRDPEDPEAGLVLLLWERSVADSAAARLLADSLSAALGSKPVTEYACPDEGRRWQAPGFAIQFNRGAVFADGLLRVLVSATTQPHELPEMFCPDAPQLPPPPRLPGRRGTAS